MGRNLLLVWWLGCHLLLHFLSPIAIAFIPVIRGIPLEARLMDGPLLLSGANTGRRKLICPTLILSSRHCNPLGPTLSFTPLDR